MQGYRADAAFDGEQAIPGGALVLVDGGVIVGVEPGSAAAPSGVTVSYTPGTTLLPGLIDAHVHLCADSGFRALDQLPELSDAEQDAIISASMTAQFAAGITAVRDLGDREWAVVDRHRGRPDGLTVVASGPPITCVDGHCANMGGEAAGVDGLRAAVRERADRGADAVKIMTSGGLMTPTSDAAACQFTVTELRAVVEEAHRLGLPVAGHAHAVSAVEQCVDAGVDTIEHCSCLGPDGMKTPPALAERMAAAGIIASPTLGMDPTAGDPPPHIQALMDRLSIRWEDRIPQVGALMRAGVTVISGGDAGINPVKPHGVLIYSLANLVECGASIELALASATATAASACGLGGRTGRLRAGLDADLLLVTGDALRDITALRSVHTVVSRGREVVTSG